MLVKLSVKWMPQLKYSPSRCPHRSPVHTCFVDTDLEASLLDIDLGATFLDITLGTSSLGTVLLGDQALDNLERIVPLTVNRLPLLTIPTEVAIVAEEQTMSGDVQTVPKVVVLAWISD